ncbi:MAG: MerR family transcriptional regulator [Devosia sp.]
MEKSPDAFRTISEAADELDLPQHVLRFWETRFSTIKPLKRGGGRRYYRPEDVLLLKGIRHLLYDQGFTIKGVQKILKDQGVRYVVGIGEGRPLEALPEPQAMDDVEPDFDEQYEDDAADVPEVEADGNGAAPAPARLKLPGFGSKPKAAGLTSADRDKLSSVLRELLDCKRLLERAREG